MMSNQNPFNKKKRDTQDQQTAKYTVTILSSRSERITANNHAELKRIAETRNARISVVRNRREVFFGHGHELLTEIKRLESLKRKL